MIQLELLRQRLREAEALYQCMQRQIREDARIIEALQRADRLSRPEARIYPADDNQ